MCAQDKLIFSSEKNNFRVNCANSCCAPLQTHTHTHTGTLWSNIINVSLKVLELMFAFSRETSGRLSWQFIHISVRKIWKNSWRQTCCRVSYRFTSLSSAGDAAGIQVPILRHIEAVWWRVTWPTDQFIDSSNVTPLTDWLTDWLLLGGRGGLS